MNKIIRKIKEKDNIIVFLIIFLITIGISLNISIQASDEIWNFQSVYKMYNGFKIYQDMNVIITPLFFLLAEGIFHIFGANLFVFRISQCFECTILYIFIYKLMKKIGISKNISLVTVFIMILQGKFFTLRMCFNYNIMAFMFCVIGIYLLIKDNNKKNYLIQAIMTVIIFLTKQNIGIYYMMGILLYIFIEDNEKKIKIKESLKYILTVAFFMCIFLIIMLIDHNLENFLNYAFGGIIEFAKENLLTNIGNITCFALIVGLSIALGIISTNVKVFNSTQIRNIKILSIFSGVMAMMAYPIFNWAHIWLGIHIAIINIIYVIYLIFEDFINIIIKISKYVSVLLTIFLIASSFNNLYEWFSAVNDEKYPYKWEDPFFGGMLSKETYDTNQKVIDYIQNNDKRVIILSNKAALYMIPLKQNNGEFDLPFKGNLGRDGEQGLIRKIDNLKDTQILITKDKEDDIYQEISEIKEYVKQTKKYVGDIEKFEIYE